MALSAQERPKIPKTLWMYWSGGCEQAPQTVKKCYQSWQKYNPDWDIRLLDQSTLGQYLPDLPKICEQNADFLNKRQALYSDVIRLNLLSNYGGVWDHATCFCCRPLDEWLNEYTKKDFFALEMASKNRMVDTWFIAASPESYLLQKWCEKLNAFLRDYGTYKCYWHEFYSYHSHLLADKKTSFLFLEKANLKIKNKLRQLLLKFSNSSMYRPILLLNTPIINWGYVPYFACHYTFSQVYFSDKKCQEIWDDIPKMGVRPATILGTKILDTPVDPQIKDHIDRRESPLYKLSYKKDKQIPTMGNFSETNLYCLFNSHLPEPSLT